MCSLPIAQTPLNQHSIRSIEFWLNHLGAELSEKDPCLWILKKGEWIAEIKIGQKELSVVWDASGRKKKCSFSYGLSREDIETALMQGP